MHINLEVTSQSSTHCMRMNLVLSFTFGINEIDMWTEQIMPVILEDQQCYRAMHNIDEGDTILLTEKALFVMVQSQWINTRICYP